MEKIEEKRFYEQDKKEYIITKNRDLLTWLNEICKRGYDNFLSLNALQEIVDKIAYWYEIKYPDREMNYYCEHVKKIEFVDIKPLSKAMGIQQLMYRLSPEQFHLINGYYRSNGGGVRNVYDKNKIIGQKEFVYYRIGRINTKYNPNTMLNLPPSFLLYADANNGKVMNDFNLSEIVKEDITLDELLILFKEKYDDKFEYSTLEDCMFNHDCDLELRNAILQLVALKLLYSRNTIPENGYERAKRFINEFNKKLGLNLSTDEIDELINKDYSDKGLFIEREKSNVEKIVGMPYEEFEKLDIDEQSKLIRHGKKIKFDSRLHDDGYPVGNINLGLSRVRSMFKNKKQ